MKFKLTVKVNPSSSHRRAVWKHDFLKVNLTSPPEDGEANRELVEYLSELLEVRPGDIEIRHGETRSRKKLFIDNIDRKDLIMTMNRLKK